MTLTHGAVVTVVQPGAGDSVSIPFSQRGMRGLSARALSC
jgi:hypothetical protein